MATGFGRGYSARIRGGRGNHAGTISRYGRHDKSFFAVLGESDQELIQDEDKNLTCFRCIGHR